MTDTVPDDQTAAPSQLARARALADVQKLQARHGLPVPIGIRVARDYNQVSLTLDSSSEIDAWARVLGLPAATSIHDSVPGEDSLRFWYYHTNGEWPGVKGRSVYLDYTQRFPVLEEQGPRPGEAA